MEEDAAKRAAFDPYGGDVSHSPYVDVSTFSDEHLMVQYLALRVWRAQLGRGDHAFLHSCSIFSNLKAVMGAAGGDDHKAAGNYDGSPRLLLLLAVSEMGYRCWLSSQRCVCWSGRAVVHASLWFGARGVASDPRVCDVIVCVCFLWVA